MANDGWMQFDGVEMVNMSRTVQLSAEMGIDSVWTTEEQVQWIEDSVGGLDYSDVTNAPWYDAGYPASAEFAGVVPMSFSGLDDSTRASTTVEFLGDGGYSGSARNGTLTVVASVYIVASTDRGADYGKRWLDRLLRDDKANRFYSGAELRYFRYAGVGAPVAHRRNVTLSRASTVTRKRLTDCASIWALTFTLTSNDPYEYGDAVLAVASLGGTATGPSLTSSGQIDLAQQDCPVFDYSPVYDPLNPALVAAPTAPNLLPAGWAIVQGRNFRRFWARLPPVEPSTLVSVPMIRLSSTVDARMVRVSVWPGLSDNNDQCDPLFSAVVSYLPANQDFYIDGERNAAYTWDGFSPRVRRTDSLVFSPNANPVVWSAFTDASQLLVTLDVFSTAGVLEGNGSVRASVSLIPKSD